MTSPPPLSNAPTAAPAVAPGVIRFCHIRDPVPAEHTRVAASHRRII